MNAETGAPCAGPSPGPGPARPTLIALGWGSVAGVVTAVVYAGMMAVQELVWSVSDARWYIPVAILVGGCLIAAMRRYSAEADLDGQIKEASDPTHLHRRRVAVLAAGAIVAFGFGGAIGPEAGLLAVVAELSALVSLRIARSTREQRLIGQVGTSAALAGVYGSPPGAAAFDDDALTPSKVPSLLAAGAGFLGFLITLRLLGRQGTEVGFPPYHAGVGQLLAAVVPALCAAVLALGYRRLRPWCTVRVQRLGSPPVQTLVGTAVLAVLATLVPAVRFSGHDQLHEIPDLVVAGSWMTLGVVAVLKLVATAVSISSGWRGGDFFPLLFSGAAAGAACCVVLPGLEASTAMVAGAGAATTIGLGRPVAALLIVAVLVGGTMWGPLAVGVCTGIVLHRLAPGREPDSSSHPHR